MNDGWIEHPYRQDGGPENTRTSELCDCQEAGLFGVTEWLWFIDLVRVQPAYYNVVNETGLQEGQTRRPARRFDPVASRASRLQHFWARFSSLCPAPTPPVTLKQIHHRNKASESTTVCSEWGSRTLLGLAAASRRCSRKSCWTHARLLAAVGRPSASILVPPPLLVLLARPPLPSIFPSSPLPRLTLATLIRLRCDSPSRRRLDPTSCGWTAS